MKSILHIGSDKCGSSSLQNSLSMNKLLKNSNGEFFKYAVIRNKKLILQPEIYKISLNKISQYLASDVAKTIYLYSDFEKNKIRNRVKSEKSNLIFSCEGWLRIMNKNYLLNLFDLVRPNKLQRTIEVVCFVRAPAYWINAAWWQWGIWNKDNNDFNRWLEIFIEYTNWFKYLSNFRKLDEDLNINVFPLEEDINKTFYTNQKIYDFKEICHKKNRSLPMEALKLYLFERSHRQDEHFSANDFVLSNLISSSFNKYSECPWILNKENIKIIMNKTNKEIKSLINLMPQINSQKIINDPAWWDINYYKNKKVHDPFLRDLKIDNENIKLSSDLLLNLNKALKILEKNGLINQFINN